ncbi:MAG: hypothetical protein IPK76_01175 [Lewinellaceae bacterium]|nr:hypothetical protein [Lewinellaceae bacterium]
MLHYVFVKTCLTAPFEKGLSRKIKDWAKPPQRLEHHATGMMAGFEVINGSEPAGKERVDVAYSFPKEVAACFIQALQSPYIRALNSTPKWITQKPVSRPKLKNALPLSLPSSKNNSPPRGNPAFHR